MSHVPFYGSRQPRLLTQEDLSHEENLPPWLPPVYREFRRNVLDPAYPCYFAVAGEKTGTLRYVAIDDPGAGIPPALMKEFIELSRRAPADRHALVVFIRPEPVVRPHRFYIAQGWDQLQKLHDQDTVPWPDDVAISPDDPHWEFCFGGEPMFVFGAMPSHQLRRSRNVGPSMLLLFQPRSVFAGIQGGTPAGTKARELIRRRLATWDLIGLHSSMGEFGDASNHEFEQYFIPDDERPSDPCPLILRGVFVPTANKATVTAGTPVPLEEAVRRLLPVSGSVEVQRDPAGRIHPWHSHPVDETLLVVDGAMTLHVDGRDHKTIAGSTIQLPAGTFHSSVAGPDGCVYIIAVKS